MPTISSITASSSALLGSIVTNLTNGLFTMLTENLPTIAGIGIAIFLLWFLIRKAKGAIGGNV